MTSRAALINPFNGFSKLNKIQRLETLKNLGFLSQSDIAYLTDATCVKLNTIAEQLVENVIGCFSLPLGIATHFRIDDSDYIIPMAVEETSIIAAASRTAKWIREEGTLTTKVIGSCVTGQLQISRIDNFARLEQIIDENAANLIQTVNSNVIPSLVARGGGVKQISVRKVPRGDGYDMAVIHVQLDVCDAMGANLINQVCEFLREPIQTLTGFQVNICILTNLSDSKLIRAQITLPNIDPDLGKRIAEAALFARQDPYRACTSNKGVLNGMDPVLIATGNDWRAVEAGVHAYAARAGRYQSITEWTLQDKTLIGVLEAPIMVGIVGGVTRIHPTAQLCLRMLKITSATQLARIVGAVGLVQNLGALRVLTSEGIVKGHMRLHINNLILAIDATESEKRLLKTKLEALLLAQQKITLTDVQQTLDSIRSEKLAA